MTVLNVITYFQRKSLQLRQTTRTHFHYDQNTNSPMGLSVAPPTQNLVSLNTGMLWICAWACLVVSPSPCMRHPVQQYTRIFMNVSETVDRSKATVCGDNGDQNTV